MRTLVKVLRQNGIVGLAVDRDVFGDGLPLEFFGAVTTFQPTAAALARRFGCPIIAAFCTRRADNRSTAVIEPPIEVHASGDEQADVVATMNGMLRLFERYIKAHAGQWVAFEPVWPARERGYSTEAG
jgi:KDO2-lipid IV(A) lauroyltransferase